MKPAIAFVLASYHEPFEVAKMTFDSARDVQYSGPREIIVVDNSRATDTEDFRRWKAYVESHAGERSDVKVRFVHNTNTAGLKPGNLDVAQALVGDAAYVVFLDVDSSLPVRTSLLEEAVADFEADAKLGLIQFHTTATNDHFNPLTRAVAVPQNGLRIKHLLRSYGGFAMFYGHNGMWRKSLLDELGPWLEHYRGNVMVTEDLLKTVQAYAHGYYAKYKEVRTGEWIPSSLDALENMWLRWTYGGQQVLFKYGKQIFFSRQLRGTERFDLLAFLASYAAAAICLPLNLLWVLFLSPEQSTVFSLLTIYLPMLLGATVVYQRYSRELKLPLAKKLWYLYSGFFLIEAFILVVNLKGVFNFAMGVEQGWKVTAKSVEATPGWLDVIRRHRLTVALALAMLGAVVASWGARHDFSHRAFVAYLPTTFMAFSLMLCVALYGRHGRTSQNSIESTTIDSYHAQNRASAAE